MRNIHTQRLIAGTKYSAISPGPGIKSPEDKVYPRVPIEWDTYVINKAMYDTLRKGTNLPTYAKLYNPGNDAAISGRNAKFDNYDCLSKKS
jgi:hypothetical protein